MIDPQSANAKRRSLTRLLIIRLSSLFVATARAAVGLAYFTRPEQMGTSALHNIQRPKRSFLERVRAKTQREGGKSQINARNRPTSFEETTRILIAHFLFSSLLFAFAR